MDKKLSELLGSIEHEIYSIDGLTSNENTVVINSLEFDSRKVKSGSLFFALPGTHINGNEFIPSAIENGANAIIFESAEGSSLADGNSITNNAFSEELTSKIKAVCKKTNNIPVFIKVKSSRFAMSPLSACFYDYPSRKLAVIGVTGTEGKSSTVSFIWQLLRLCGKKAGFFSTVQYSFGGDAIANPEHQTTPEAPIVQRELYEMVQNGCEYAVVESSSHGLSCRTNRLGDVAFDCAIFMNVTLEHLEFHGTYEQYKSDKANLFRALDKYNHEKTILGEKRMVEPFGIVNLEDPAATYFIHATTKSVVGFTTEGKAGKAAAENALEADALPKIPNNIPYYSARNIASARFGIAYTIHAVEGFSHNANTGHLEVKAGVHGAFNAYNITAAIIAVSRMTGIKAQEVCEKCAKLTSVKGRMTIVDEGQPFEVIVDYAHTPSSFETIFPPVKSRCTGKMICVFGSGGERDHVKRPLQGEIAAKFCDTVILTDEDPRQEDEMAILNEIAKGALKDEKMRKGENLLLITDRKEAIRKAFSIAQKNDIVLLLGKGHENSIIYKDRVMPYDEISEAKQALSEMGFKRG